MKRFSEYIEEIVDSFSAAKGKIFRKANILKTPKLFNKYNVMFIDMQLPQDVESASEQQVQEILEALGPNWSLLDKGPIPTNPHIISVFKKIKNS